MKYIDAEKLTTIIEERKAQQDQWINSYHDPIDQGISHELTEILSIITSLQEEQPPTEREIAEAHSYAEMIRERDRARIQQKQVVISDTDKSNLRNVPAIIRASNHPFKENLALTLEKYI